MPKMPFIKFYPDAWLYDTRVLTDEEKSAWIDLLCFMWNAPERGVLTAHPQDMARMLGREWLALSTIIEALERKGVCNVSRLDNGHVTLLSRRMSRDSNALKLNAERQERFRLSNILRQRRAREKSSNASVTAKKLEDRSQKLDKDKDILPCDLPQNGKPTAEYLLDLWNKEAHPNLPRIKFLTETRKRQALARLSANPEESFWKDVLQRVNRSPLLRGEAGSWRATFDWILNPSNLVKIMEGNYEPNKRR